MRKIIIPDSVRQAVDDRPELRDVVARLKDGIHQRFDQDERVPFAIGNSSRYGGAKLDPRFENPDGCAWPPNQPGCFGGQRLCDMKRVSLGIIVNGGAAFNLQMEPSNSAWFDPRAIRATIVDANNADLNHRVLITAVTVNDSPIEATNITAPVAPAVVNGTRFDGWWSDDWQDPDSYAVGVSWPVFSDLNNKMPLRIIGIAAFLPAATFVAATFTIYGNPANNPPPEGAARSR